ncbi:MAG TPA: hypothetical protein VFE32_14085 [Puia sp.]|jgi:hypothetical protein|nr:hypothetical protein [Puia sp.]
MSRHILYILTLCFLISATCRGQSTIPSPEKFVNEVFPKVIDSTRSRYFLVAGTDSCRFVKFNYDDWADHHLAEPVPISILNELAEKVYHSRQPYFWKQDSLSQGVCITHRQADSILYLGGNRHVYSFSLPQFTGDGQYAVIDLNMVCGAACGLGATYIFRRTSSGWKVAGEYTNWQMPVEPRH